MKTLCHKKTDESLHVFSDTTEVYLNNGSLWFKYKGKEDFEIKGYDEENYILYENVEHFPYWLNRTYKYNPSYGWKCAEEYFEGEEKYENYLRRFLRACSLLKEKNILNDEEYQKLIDFKEIESILYYPISHYMKK